MRRTADDIYNELLVLRSQDGDIEAVEKLIHRWSPRLLRHAYRLTGDREAAADTAQEAWVAIMRGLARLNDPARFPAWAYRITTFKSADWTRRRTRDRDHHDHDVHRQRDIESRAVEPGRSNDAVELLRHAMHELSGEHYAALSLYYLDELSVKEIAEAMNIPNGTVKSRLHNARQQLKTTMERMNHEPV
jgi:RNA polymerase sigma factor (sigma-70 family)